MEKAYIRDLIYTIGGYKRLGESDKDVLVKVSDISGVSYSALRAIYYGQEDENGRCIGMNGYPITKENLEKLKRSAAHAKETWDLIAFTEHKVNAWRRADPERFKPYIDAACEFIGRLRADLGAVRQESEATGEMGFLAGNKPLIEVTT